MNLAPHIPSFTEMAAHMDTEITSYDDGEAWDWWRLEEEIFERQFTDWLAEISQLEQP